MTTIQHVQYANEGQTSYKVAWSDGSVSTVPQGHRFEQKINDWVASGNTIATAPQPNLDAERVREIDVRLREIDLESVRPLRAINNATDIQADHDILAALEEEAAPLRDERATLVT